MYNRFNFKIDIGTVACDKDSHTSNRTVYACVATANGVDMLDAYYQAIDMATSELASNELILNIHLIKFSKPF